MIGPRRLLIRAPIRALWVGALVFGACTGAWAQQDPAAEGENPEIIAPLDGQALPDLPSAGEALQPDSALGVDQAGRFQTGAGAQLRALDRIAGQTQDLDLSTGQTGTAFRLDVTLGECRYPAADPSSDAFAHLTIRDRGAVVFEGWMEAASPALSALDHPRYDIWVLGCSGL